jgi:hypothetical protein
MALDGGYGTVGSIATVEIGTEGSVASGVLVTTTYRDASGPSDNATRP